MAAMETAISLFHDQVEPAPALVNYVKIGIGRPFLETEPHDWLGACLSAILPAGEQLDDMTAWIRSDAEGEPVRSEWRPTKQRFGTLEWQNGAATLRYSLENDGPFVSRFLTEMAKSGGDHIPMPRDVGEITLMGAWRFANEGKRTLIFVTQPIGSRALQPVPC